MHSACCILSGHVLCATIAEVGWVLVIESDPSVNQVTFQIIRRSLLVRPNGLHWSSTQVTELQQKERCI